MEEWINDSVIRFCDNVIDTHVSKLEQENSELRAQLARCVEVLERVCETFEYFEKNCNVTDDDCYSEVYNIIQEIRGEV